jgi:hypothetical protein
MAHRVVSSRTSASYFPPGEMTRSLLIGENRRGSFANANGVIESSA